MFRKRSISATVLGALAAACLAGCFSTRFVNARLTPGVVHEEWYSFFFWGLAGHPEIDARALCGGEIQQVEIGTTVGTWFLSAITLGIYSPQKVSVTCAAQGEAAPSNYRVEIDLDGQGNPSWVEKRSGDEVLAGRPRPDPAQAGRWRVALRAGGEP